MHITIYIAQIGQNYGFTFDIVQLARYVQTLLIQSHCIGELAPFRVYIREVG